MIVVRIRDNSRDDEQGEWHWFILAGKEYIARCFQFYPLDSSEDAIEEIDPQKAKIILGRQLSKIAESKIQNGLVTMLYQGTLDFDPTNLLISSYL